MIELQKTNAALLAPLFEKTNGSSMILPFIQGHMGRGWVDDLSAPTCALVIVGDFCYLAGDHRGESPRHLVEHAGEIGSPFLMMIPPSKEWGALIEEVYKDRCRLIQRYPLKKIIPTWIVNSYSLLLMLSPQTTPFFPLIKTFTTNA